MITNKLSIRLKHPTLDLGCFCASINLTPDRVLTAGLPRKTPKGNPIPGVEPYSLCTFSVGSDCECDISQRITKALGVLMSRKDELKRITESGGGISFFIGLFLDGNAGFTITREQLKIMSDMGISIDFLLYPPDGDDANGDT